MIIVPSSYYPSSSKGATGWLGILDFIGHEKSGQKITSSGFGSPRFPLLPSTPTPSTPPWMPPSLQDHQKWPPYNRNRCPAEVAKVIHRTTWPKDILASCRRGSASVCISSTWWPFHLHLSFSTRIPCQGIMFNPSRICQGGKIIPPCGGL